MDYTAIVTASISLIGTALLGLLQLRKLKSEASNLDSISTTNLVKLALEINKQDLDTLRTVNSDLKSELKDRDTTIDELRNTIKEKDEMIWTLRSKLECKDSGESGK